MRRFSTLALAHGTFLCANQNAHRTVPCDNKEVHVNEDIQDLTYQNSIDHAIRYNHGVAYRRYDRIQ